MFDFLKHSRHAGPALIATALMPLLLTGCILEDNPCPDDLPKSDGTWLSMRVVNVGSNPGRTRADDAGHPDEPATDPENYILPTDMTIMLFDNRQLLRHIFTPEEITVEPASGSQYNLKFKLNSDYFSYAGSLSSVDFSLMVVANREGLGGYASAFDSRYLSMTPAQIAAQYPRFDMAPQSAEAWMPNSADKRIPMSGIASFTGKNLSVSNTADNPLDLGTLNIQRNLCKVRVLADLQALGGSDYDQITSVSLSGVKEGAFIPVVKQGDPDWYAGTAVMETPTGDGWWDQTVDVVMQAAPQTSIVTGQTYDNAFHCYVPEALITEGSATLTITANMKENPTETKTWTLDLSKAYGNDYKGISSFVRNHIYEFVVQAVSGTPLKLTLNVADWTAQTVTWDYSDNPGVADGGWLTWTDLNGATQPDGTTRLIFGSNQNQAATGQFQFSQPVGGEWTASFAPDGNTEADAFCFVDADGNLLNTISGTISEGVQSTIRVRPRRAPGNLTRSARLIFTVRTPDGRILTGDLVEDEDEKHFTLVQNPIL